MKKITIFLAIGALVLFMGGCGEKPAAGGDIIIPPDTAAVTDTVPPDQGVTQPTDAPIGTEPTQDNGVTTSPDATQDVEPSGDATPDPDQSLDTGDGGSDQPQDTATPKPTKSVKPTATPKATAKASGSDSAEETAAPDDSSGEALSAGKVTGTANVSDSLSLRETASSTAKAVAKIQKGEKLTVTGVNKDSKWLKVEFSGKSGYVLAKYVQINGSSKNKVCMVSSSGTLNVRSGAATSKKLLGSVKSGAMLVVTEVVKASPDNWYKVILSDKTTGYVNAKYCRIAS